MSIWASGFVAGENDDGDFTADVVSYINGWSNHYPGHFVNPHPPPLPAGFSRDVTEETPASIGTGWIPPWCVPGHHDAEEQGLDVDTHLGPWLRLDITMQTVSIWAGLEIGNQDVHSICLNETAVRALRDNLNEWLDREKLHPTDDKGN